MQGEPVLVVLDKSTARHGIKVGVERQLVQRLATPAEKEESCCERHVALAAVRLYADVCKSKTVQHVLAVFVSS